MALGGILNEGLTDVAAISNRVQDALNAIKDLKPTDEDFQQQMLLMQTNLDSLKKQLDAIEQAVRSFHRP